MHPLLASPRRIGLYLLAWIFPAALMMYLAHGLTRGQAPWSAIALMTSLLIFVYALVCLSPWYSCRVLPLKTPGLGKAIVSHIAAAIIASTFWVGATRGLAELMETSKAGIATGIQPHLPAVFAMGVMLYLLATAMYYVYIAIESSHEATRREHEATALAREAELKALKAQINPHFLFNCLHSISALTSIDPAQARDMCIRLSDFLRNTLRLGDRPSIALGDELALVNTYLAVEQVRFGSRLRVEQEIDAACDGCQIPPLLLQPLVENAVKHGIAGLVDGGFIRLEASCANGVLRIAVENDFDPEHPAPRKTGLGLSNVRSRVAARHGERGHVSVAVRGGIHRVEVALPCDGEKQELAATR
jgi:two-component system, LytTR family, sensor histidine kinase AlgZ